MASPAREARLRVLEAHPNARVIERGRGHLRMYDPDRNKIIYQTQVGNMGWHYGEQFDQEVDTDWVYIGPGWEMVKAEYNATLQGNTYTYTDPATGESVSLTISSVPQWVNELDQRQTAADLQQSTPQASGDVITFPSLIGAGADLRIQAQTARLAKRLIVPSLSTFNTPTLSGTVSLSLNFTFQTAADVYIDGVLWDKNETINTASPIEFRSAGVPVFYFSVPFAVDAMGEQVTGSMTAKQAGNNLFVEVRIPYEWMQTASYPIEIDPSVEPQVSESSADGYSDESQTAATLTGTTLYIGTGNLGNDPERAVGFRFIADVPQYATVTSAYLTVCATNTTGYTPPLQIYGDDTGNASVWATTPHLENQVTKTSVITFTANVDRVTDTWQRFHSGGEDDFGQAVHSIVNRSDWSSGNGMRFLVQGGVLVGSYNSQPFYSYDGNTSYAAKLYIEYSAATLEQEGYRWRNDDGSESAATWKADQDTTTSVAQNTNIRLRMLMNATGDYDATTYQLEYRQNGSSHAWRTVK